MTGFLIGFIIGFLFALYSTAYVYTKYIENSGYTLTERRVVPREDEP